MKRRERLGPPSLASYFFALTSREQGVNRTAETAIEDEFGALATRSECYCFSEFSEYYDEELGGSCWKYLVALDQPKPVDQLASVKLRVEGIEQRLSRKSGKELRRTVNIDPGYLTGWQVVLSSVKNHAHRIYLSEGIYSELTLLYRGGEFESLPWTYRDYLAPEVLEFFGQLRSVHVRQMKELQRL
jgi:hypothetical protein